VSISYPSTSTIASTVTTGVLTVTTASTQIIAANTNRAAGSLLVNNTNKVVWIRMSDNTNPAAVSGATSLSIPANGGNYLLPAGYQGAVQGILAASATGTVQFIEPNY
jgi:hypothetical protein